MVVATNIKLHQRNIVTADTYHMDGMYHFCCYDLDTFGSQGAAVKAAQGGRYVWVPSPDHPIPGIGYADGASFYVGYSNDPGVPPEKMTGVITTVGFPSHVDNTAHLYHLYHLVYNPDDAGGKVFYLYGEATDSFADTNQIQHVGGVMRSSDMVNWDPADMRITHDRPTDQNTGFTSFHHVVRRGTGDWFSIGLSWGALIYPLGFQWFGHQSWSSTDGLTFTCDSNRLLNWSGSAISGFGPVDFITGKQISSRSPPFITVGGTLYKVFFEDARHGGDGMYATLCPMHTAACLDSSFPAFSSPYMINDSGTPAMERITPIYGGRYPSSEFLQDVTGYTESGIYHIWCSHGYFSDEANPTDGVHEQWYDYYTFVYDATAAASAAPVGVRADCRYGCVILSWYDALPHRNYRVYRSSDGSTWGSALGDITGTKYVHAVGAGSPGLWYYKVVTMNGATEAGSRIVKQYISNGRSLTNKHLTRVYSEDATAGATINQGYLDACVGWLTDNGLIDECLYWADTAFGVSHTANAISKIYCLGSTIHPRGGDYTPKTPVSTTYSTTAMGSTVPGWTNTLSGYGHFGGIRGNNIRRKAEITYGAVYAKSDTTNLASILDYGVNVNGRVSNQGWLRLSHTAGTPGAILFENMSQPADVAASFTPASATATHIAIGTCNITSTIVYVNGVASTAVTGVTSTISLNGDKSNTTAYTLVSGSALANLDTTVAAPRTRTFPYSLAAFKASTLFVFDRALTPFQAKSFYTFLNTRLGGASYSIPSYNTPFYANIKSSPYSAAGDDSADDSDNFAAFKTAVDTWQASNTGLVVLQVPTGTYRFVAATGSQFTAGIRKFLMLGDDRATTILSDASGTGAGFFLGAGGVLSGVEGGMYFDNAHGVRAPNMNAGDTTVTLSSAALFNNGDWVCVAGLDLQGYGDPCNPYYFEYRQVTKSGSTLTFDRPLENSYKSTWPLYNSGDAFHSDCGGPATVFLMKPYWNCEHEYVDLTANQSVTKSEGRLITLTRVAAGPGAGWWATVADQFRAYDFEHTFATMEVDKLCRKAVLNNGIIYRLLVQSASVDELVIRGGIAIPSGLVGTPKVFYADGFFIDNGALFGPTAFGIGYGTGSRVTMLQGSIIGGINGGGGTDPDLHAYGYTMSGGVITVPKANGPIWWAVPGAKVLFSGHSNMGSINTFTVVDVAESGSNTVITTNLSGRFPLQTGTLSIRTHPAPFFLMRSVTNQVLILGGLETGAGEIRREMDYSGGATINVSVEGAAPGEPLYSRSSRNYNGLSVCNNDSFPLWGKLVSMTVNVTTPYAGSHSTLSLSVGGRVAKSDGTYVLWLPSIDLKTAGVRTITPSTPGTSLGADSALVFPSNPGWLGDSFGGDPGTFGFCSFDVSSENSPNPIDGVGPYVSVTYVTDQTPMTTTEETGTTTSIVNPVLALRMRLHS